MKKKLTYNNIINDKQLKEKNKLQKLFFEQF